MRKPSQGPLQGIRILDLTRLLPGPLGTMLMADMGAEVIKIEDPKQPDFVRNFPPYKNGVSMNYMAFNRSKLSFSLDFTTEEGKNTFLTLVKTADVVVEQFRPKFLDKYGIGYEDAKKINEKIIYISITGYGQTGPYAHLAGHDLNYTSVAGVLGVTGKTDEPIPTGVQLADIAGGSYMCVIATLSAIHARNQTGKGQQVDVSMTDAVMPLLTPLIIKGDYLTPMQENATRGNFALSGGLPNYGVYKTSDQKFIALGTLEPKFWQKFCTLLNKPDWMAFIIPENEQKLAEYKNKISELIRSQSRSYWIDFGSKNDLLISAVNELDELCDDPHLQAREMLIEEEHPKTGKFISIGVPLKFSETPAKPSWIAPELGEDTQDILQSL
ncbi:Acetyl-CoA:oxalate CoA-transferase [Emticicia aquatica]|uniref:Acetyl-CoA:oxalate CoA-transferase n=1 Tax=Emticicia aquatica TaxID=1681835 RepID=A0ABN8EN78_9BACT|nr:CoA transferase [Emticicia aquatica]CAH0994020.1 Acetyl-CoA:oxalate CoA-transferase [Emticicia aquatica]